MVEIKKNTAMEKWAEFLKICPQASIYHTPEWKMFLENTFDYKPYYLFAIDECGQIIGMLPLFLVRSKLTGNRLCSLPFAHSCGPIGNDEAIHALLEYAIDGMKDTEESHLEIRDSVPNTRFKSHNMFSSYILDLSMGLEQIWTNFSSNVRRGIRKSQKSGIKVFKTKDIKDLKLFYELNCITKRNIGVPAHPWKFFKNLFQYLGEYEQLYLAEYDDEIIGGGIREYYGFTVLAGYAASNPEYARYNPFNAINWESIRDACQKGYKIYDLGRVSHDNKGLEFYKSRWGTAENKLYYSYFPKNPVTFSGNRDNFKYNIATKAIQKLPMPLYKPFSEYVFQHFG